MFHLNLKGATRTIGRFIRRNRNKILMVAAHGSVVLATGLAVRAGMKANEEITVAESLVKEEQGPEATLPKSEKRKIVIKHVIPAAVSALTSIVCSSVMAHGLATKAAMAAAVTDYYANRTIVQPAPENDKQDKPESEIVLPEPCDGPSRTAEFDVYEPLTGQTIRHVTAHKLAVTEYAMNLILKNERQIYLDWIIQILGGDAFPPASDLYRKYLWQGFGDWDETVIDYTCGIEPQWLSFRPCIDGDRVILRFSQEPIVV